MSKDCTEQPKAGKADRAPKQAAQAAAPAPAAAAPAPAARPADSTASASGGTRKCYHCGQAGHKASECSQAPKEGGARQKPKEKDEPSFKERLEAYKASNPEPGKKNFCYLCGKEGRQFQRAQQMGDG